MREIGSGKRSRFIFNRQEQQGHKLHLASDSWNENFEPAERLIQKKLLRKTRVNNTSFGTILDHKYEGELISLALYKQQPGGIKKRIAQYRGIE